VPYRALREEELFIRIEWFIKLRWIFLIGLLSTIFVATQIFNVSLPLKKILIVGGVLLLYNSIFYSSHRFLKSRMKADLRRMQIETNLQMTLDLVALTFLIHYSGGVENPFMFFYIFHAIIGSILLSRTEVWVQGGGAFSLFVLFIVLEYFEIIPHYHLKGFFPKELHQNLLYISVVCLVLLATISTTIYISSTIVKGLRDREKELFLTRYILQKKTDDLGKANLELVEKQKQLVQSEKLASLGQLVSGIAHEINNPIQFIQGNLHIFQEAFENIIPILDIYSENRQNLEIARLKYPFFKEHIQVLVNDMDKGSERIRNIIRDLKTFARRDEGRMDEEVDLNEVVRVCTRLVHNKIKHYQVEESLDPDLPQLRGSENKLEQVVIATLINAAEAIGEIPNGAIKIITRTEDGGKSVSLSISDNGPGMSEELKDRIFDPFFTTKQRTGGTGLGLSITYGIIQEHGGHIKVDCQVGKGTTFTYYLPVDRLKGVPNEPDPGD